MYRNTRKDYSYLIIAVLYLAAVALSMIVLVR
jgi:hypothetical protein